MRTMLGVDIGLSKASKKRQRERELGLHLVPK
jgi:hypothetical protein